MNGEAKRKKERLDEKKGIKAKIKKYNEAIKIIDKRLERKNHGNQPAARTKRKVK